MITKINTPMSQVLKKKYIELYINARENGSLGKETHIEAMYCLQEIVIAFMQEKPNEISIIAKAYENIKSDKSLSTMAQIAFDLRNCSEQVKAQYMPLII